ncbi:MAG: GNAT family N-acetyltransferase [Chloroflexota bacterium]|nr:GNAT family N-acetyltransferase [Chloroflexota bacterium]
MQIETLYTLDGAGRLFEVSEAGVETLAAFRGRGYATRAVTGWVVAVREQGRIPLYSASWDNLALRGAARRLELLLYGVDLRLR